MEPASRATLAGAANWTNLHNVLAFEISRRARLAPCRETSNVCVMGQQIARLEEDHI